MALISDVVNVNINRETSSVQRASFGVGLFIDNARYFTERVKSFASLTEMTQEGIPSHSQAYLAATRYFGANPAPQSLLIGRRDTTDIFSITPSAPTVTGEQYSLTIIDSTGSELAISFTGTLGDSVSDIVDDLIAADSGWQSVNLSPTDETGFLEVNNPSGNDFVIKDYTSNLAVQFQSNGGAGSWGTDIDSIRAENDGWYQLSTYAKTDSDILAIAAYIEGTNSKTYGASTDNTDDVGSNSTGIISQLSDLSYDRTFIMWSADAATNYPEAAWQGTMLPKDAGSASWAFKTLSGVAVDTMPSGNSANIRSYDGNTYERIGGVPVTREGVVSSGEYIDIIRGSDWFEARLEERVFGIFVRNDKVPYTDAGAALIEAEIRAQIQEAIDVGFIDGDSGYTVTVPRVATISSNLKAAREFPTITFSATLQGAIHKSTITGTLSL